MGNMFTWGASSLLQHIGESLGGTINDLTKTADTYSNAGSTNPQDLADYHSRLVFDYALKNRKLYTQTKQVKILGVKNLVLNEKSVKYTDNSDVAYNALRDNANTVFDSTTYPDRATLKLYNGRGFDVYLKSMTLEGNRVMQYSGENGELIHDSLKRDDDIRRNGETVFEVGNEFIVTADQCARIADYWYKFLGKKKHVYSLQIPGMAAWYNVGDWYNLTVGEADTNEYIDAVVECYAVDVERVAGTIGSTTLLLRDVEDNWSKTTLYAARLATGGSPKRRVNRSNIVTVASSEYDGTYDWRCDGTADDVQIQAAIDYVYNTFGGGTVQLTSGTYNTTTAISVKASIVIEGTGANTHLTTSSNINLFEVSGAGSKIHKCKITGKDSTSYAAIQVDAANFTVTDCTIANVLEVNALNCDAYSNVITASTAGAYITGTKLTKINGVHVVASSTYTGEYSLRCDGTDDDVQIQAAIDYISTTYGGGTVALTNGAYTLGATLTMKSNVILKGVGNSTILYPESASITTMIDFGTATGSSIEDFTVDGNGASITFITDAMKVIDGQALGKAKGIAVQNYYFSCTTGTKNFYLLHDISASLCVASGNEIENTGTLGYLNCFDNCKGVTSCSSNSNTATGAGAIYLGFLTCSNVASCSSYSNTTAGGQLNSFFGCTNISSCSSYSNSTSGTSADLYSYGDCTNISSCSSYSNTTSGTSAEIYSFFACTRLTVCNTSSNASSTSDEYGYSTCTSVQQCKSSGDSIPYGTGATQSYADSGSSNACADTAAGGYNS